MIDEIPKYDEFSPMQKKKLDDLLRVKKKQGEDVDMDSVLQELYEDDEKCGGEETKH